MSWVESWLDTAIAPSASTCIAALNQAKCRGLNAYIGGRNSGGSGWTTSLLQAVRAAAPWPVGFFGTWVSLIPGGASGYAVGFQDGLDAVAVAAAYGPLLWGLAYDVEPNVWDTNPTGTLQAMNGFRDAVTQKGWRSMIYGLQTTLTAAGNSWDAYWGTADLGSNDPGRSAGIVGKRSIQYGAADFAGLNWDLSNSEFSIAVPKSIGGGKMLIQHPTITGRVDAVWIGVDGNLYHTWESNNSFGGMLNGSNVNNWGQPPDGPLMPLSASCAWDSTGQHFMVFAAAAPTGHLWGKQINITGATDFDWSVKANVPSNVAQGAPGAVGPHTHPVSSGEPIPG